MDQTFVFVYLKDAKIKVLPLFDSKENHSALLADGWVHTTTLDACAFLERLCNDCNNKDLIDEIKSLFNAPLKL